jgi:hypothetical protein
MTTHTPNSPAFAAELCADDIPAAGPAPHGGPVPRLVRFGAGRQGCAAGGEHQRFAMSWGRHGKAESADFAPAHQPLFAAMANAAASHVAEQDDVHNGSVFHPATVVFPPALAVAQAIGASGRELLTACVAGYEVGIRVGEFLGRSHYKCLPHHGHGRHAGRRGCRGQAAEAGRLSRCCTPSARPALNRRGCGNSCARAPTASSCTPRMRRRRTDGRLSRGGRIHRRAAHPGRPAGHGRRHVQRR